MWEARKRGVLFDLGHGGGSFMWPVATAAMKQAGVTATAFEAFAITGGSPAASIANWPVGKTRNNGMPRLAVSNASVYRAISCPPGPRCCIGYHTAARGSDPAKSRETTDRGGPCHA